MGKEIERKWLLKDGVNIEELVQGLPFIEIKDYYFNSYCRLRIVNGEKYSITIKSDGYIVRDEYVFTISRHELDFFPPLFLTKKRYFLNYGGNTFEINIFECLPYKDKPLILIELELESMENIILTPPFLGDEVTFDKYFYGYNLFNKLVQ